MAAQAACLDVKSDNEYVFSLEFRQQAAALP